MLLLLYIIIVPNCVSRSDMKKRREGGALKFEKLKQNQQQAQQLSYRYGVLSLSFSLSLSLCCLQ